MGKDFKDGGLWSTAVIAAPSPRHSGENPRVIAAPTPASFRRKPESRGGRRGMAWFVFLWIPACAGMT